MERGGKFPLDFGKHTLVARLGRGGMGEVFLAYTEGAGGVKMLHVIKRLHPNFLDEEMFVEMFLDEARLAARLDHPNIVQTTEVGEVDGLYYLAMEYLEGQSLDRVLRLCQREQQPIPVGHAVRVVVDALTGLHHAHELKNYDGSSLNIVHRDVTPGNVFVSYNGATKLLDFGIAKASIQQSRTRTGTRKGKSAYMPPEQITGIAVDRRADIWSVGVLLTQAITGVSPFAGASEVETLRRVLDADLPDFGSMPRMEQSGLVPIVEKALQRDPEKRYQTAEEMREDLEEFLPGQPASRSSLAGFMGGWFAAERDQQRCKVAELITVDGPGAAGASDSSPPTIRPGPDADGPSMPQTPITPRNLRPRRGPPMLMVALLLVVLVLVAGLFFALGSAAGSAGQQQKAFVPEETPAQPSASQASQGRGPLGG